MGRVISDLGSFSETVANGDLLVCHNVSKAVNTRDEKLTVEKLLTDALGNRNVTITSGGDVGIGTTSPALRLTVDGGTGLPATSGTAQNGSIRMKADSSDFCMDVGVDAATGKSWIQVTNRANLSGAFSNPLLLNPNGGLVGIGTTTPSEKLHVVGGARISNLTSGTVYSDANGVLNNSASDARMKTDVEPIGAADALAIVDALRPVRYRWNEEYAPSLGEQVEVGLIAQEVQAHVPEVIGTNRDGMLSLEYARLTALLIGAVQTLTARVEALEAAAAA